MAEKQAINLTEKSAMVLGFLQGNPGGYFGDEIAEATDLNPRGIHGVLNSLVKHDLVGKEKAMRERVRKDKDGNEKTVEVEATVYSLTDAGIAFVIE